MVFNSLPLWNFFMITKSIQGELVTRYSKWDNKNSSSFTQLIEQKDKNKVKKFCLRARVVNEELWVDATTEDATAIGWNGHADHTQFVFGHHRINFRGLSFFIRDVRWEGPQTNGLIRKTRDDERPVRGEFHGGDAVSVSNEIVALEESRLMFTACSEAVFFEWWNYASRVERSSSVGCAWCSDRIGDLWRLLLFLWFNNSNDRNL